LIGDTTHGEGRHNRLFRTRYGLHRLLLHAHELEVCHPNGGTLQVRAPLDDHWLRLLTDLGWASLDTLDGCAQDDKDVC
jgi:tRNA pseudouridine65 synthase